MTRKPFWDDDFTAGDAWLLLFGVAMLVAAFLATLPSNG